MSQVEDFYNKEYSDVNYASAETMKKHPFYNELQSRIDMYSLENAKCLEVGSGRGALQDVVFDYTGMDLSEEVKKYYHKPFVSASATDIPFSNDTFDCIWSYAVLEHIHNPQKALEEMCRVLKNGGLILLSPAWQCRTWNIDGYPVRPYSDFNVFGKLYKFIIPLLNSLVVRSAVVFPRRFVRLCQYYKSKNNIFNYKKLNANYEHFWMSDSDACNSMDPYDAILWFKKNGNECLNYHSGIKQFFIRTGIVVIKVNK